MIIDIDPIELKTDAAWNSPLLRNSIQKIPVESMIAVSSIRVRSAHGNSFDIQRQRAAIRHQFSNLALHLSTTPSLPP
jgi:hypothetical protein